jgi:hypothetical protein
MLDLLKNLNNARDTVDAWWSEQSGDRGSS